MIFEKIKTQEELKIFIKENWNEYTSWIGLIDEGIKYLISLRETYLLKLPNNVKSEYIRDFKNLVSVTIKAHDIK